MQRKVVHKQHLEGNHSHVALLHVRILDQLVENQVLSKADRHLQVVEEVSHVSDAEPRSLVMHWLWLFAKHSESLQLLPPEILAWGQ